MKLSEIFSQLTTGELSQLGVGGAKSGAILEADYPKLINHINLGLADLYSRFTIRKGYLLLQLQPGKQTYSLTAPFSVNSRRSREEVRYIIDTPEEPYQEDITKVERITGDSGYEYLLNVEGSVESMFTPSPTLLRLPKCMVFAGTPDHLKSTHLEIWYRATHPLIVKNIGPFDPTRIETELPRVFLQALLYFVASRAHNPAGLTNEFHTGNSYAMKYEQECARLQAVNLQVDHQRENTRLERTGWV